jgi:hypothetical protein
VFVLGGQGVAEEKIPQNGNIAKKNVKYFWREHGFSADGKLIGRMGLMRLMGRMGPMGRMGRMGQMGVDGTDETDGADGTNETYERLDIAGRGGARGLF